MAVEAIACRGELSRQPFRGQAEIVNSPLFEIAVVLVRLEHIASIMVNADHSIM
jgi:hypothetical protein